MTYDDITLAEAEILDRFGDRVSVLSKRKRLRKFGRLDTVGTSLTTVATNGDETYVTSDLIDRISSSSASDTQSVSVEGHRVVGTGASAQFFFVVQTITLDGQTPVTLPIPLARVSRVAHTGSINFVGSIYVFQSTSAVSGGVPSDSTKIHLIVPIAQGTNQSLKCSTTFSNFDYFLCSGFRGSVLKKQSAIVDLRLEKREAGGVFKPIDFISLNTVGQTSFEYTFPELYIVPKNSDLRIRAVSSAAGTDVSASFSGYLARI